MIKFKNSNKGTKLSTTINMDKSNLTNKLNFGNKNNVFGLIVYNLKAISDYSKRMVSLKTGISFYYFFFFKYLENRNG